MKSKKKLTVILLAAAAVILLAAGAIISATSSKPAEQQTDQTEVIATEAKPTSHMISGVKATLQDTLKAGCETHACTSLLQSLGFDIDIYAFAENYLDCHYVYEDENGETFGPDMNSAFAGSAYAGWGIYAPAMARCMNNYLKDMKSDLKAYVIENKSLEELTREYIDNDVPVMIWATTDMQEPIESEVWTVNYVDENAKYKIGDKFKWMLHEHCLVLCGYDEKDYYFSDSVAGDISHFEKSVCQKRYEQLGYQAIVVK